MMEVKLEVCIQNKNTLVCLFEKKETAPWNFLIPGFSRHMKKKQPPWSFMQGSCSEHYMHDSVFFVRKFQVVVLQFYLKSFSPPLFLEWFCDSVSSFVYINP